MGKDEGSSKHSGEHKKHRDKHDKHKEKKHKDKDSDREHKKRRKHDGDDEDGHRKHKHRKREKEVNRDRDGENKMEIVDDDPKDDGWKDKDITMDGERVRQFFSSNNLLTRREYRFSLLIYQHLKASKFPREPNPRSQIPLSLMRQRLRLR